MADIKLIRLNKEEGDVYIKRVCALHAKGLIEANPDEDSAKIIQKARSNIFDILKNGFETDNQYFFKMIKDQETVGNIWAGTTIELEKKVLYIWHVHVEESHRRKGHAQVALDKLEEIARKELDAEKIILNVYAFNRGAYELYKKSGYSDFSVKMVKDL